MTNPKDTAPDSDQVSNGQTGLGDSIDELEQLIDHAKNRSVKEYDDNIPILDELVMADDINSDEYTGIISNVKMSELANTIEEKLSDELNALLDILKSNIKDSIIEEINTRLTTTEKDTNNPPDNDPE